MLQPKLPGVLRNAFVNSLAKLSSPRNAIQTGQFFAKFDAVHHARAWFYRFAGCRCWITGFVRHAFLLTRVLLSHLTANAAKFLVARNDSMAVRANPIVAANATCAGTR